MIVATPPYAPRALYTWATGMKFESSDNFLKKIEPKKKTWAKEKKNKNNNLENEKRKKKKEKKNRKEKERA